MVPKPKLASLMAWVARFLAAYPRSFRSEPISSLDSRSVFILMKLAFPINQSNNLLMFYRTNARERNMKNKGRDLRVRDIEEEPGAQWRSLERSRECDCEDRVFGGWIFLNRECQLGPIS